MKPVIGPLLVLVLLAGCTWETGSDPRQADATDGARPGSAETALTRACSWLWRQQAADGGWHSETYGLLQSGQAYTPFILHALLDVPESIRSRPEGGVERGLRFIRRHVNDEGALGLADPDVPEYPNYATAYALQCLIKRGAVGDRTLIRKMRSYLVDQQYRSENGFGLGHPAHGGWGFGGALREGDAGHMDLAHTRRVLQALRLARVEAPEVDRRAEHFLRMVQRHPDDSRPQPTPSASAGDAAPAPYDGGFYFSPVVLSANKAGETPVNRRYGFRSYATATCDGLLALLAAGVDRDDDRVRQAIRWLEEHPRLDRPQGIPPDSPVPWGEALYYYHLAVRAEVAAELDRPGPWREEIGRLLVASQQPNGRFVNTDSHLMKEDDPLLATALAVVALSRCVR